MKQDSQPHIAYMIVTCYHPFPVARHTEIGILIWLYDMSLPTGYRIRIFFNLLLHLLPLCDRFHPDIHCKSIHSTGSNDQFWRATTDGLRRIERCNCFQSSDYVGGESRETCTHLHHDITLHCPLYCLFPGINNQTCCRLARSPATHRKGNQYVHWDQQ